ncbi:MAG: tetratricopeptide repeat protein [Myxococcota bacterium]
MRNFLRLPLSVLPLLGASLPALADAPAAAPVVANNPAPLPNVALVLLAPAQSVKTEDRHLGALVSVVLEEAALASTSVNVVTQGAQAEMMDDLGIPLGALLDERTAARLAQLSGASHVVFGTYAPAPKGGFLWDVKVLSGTPARSKPLVNLTGTPTDALSKIAAALTTELGVSTWTLPAVPTSPKGQVGYVRCVAFAAVALERAGIKGRDVAIPANVQTACEDARADATNPMAEGVSLATRALAGDAAAGKLLAAYVDAHPLERLPLLARVRQEFSAGRRAEALALLGKVQAARPRDPDVLRLTGELHMEAQQWDKAKAAFAAAAAQVPQSPYLRYRLSYATYRADQPDEAMAHARAALALSGGDSPFYQLNLGERLLDARFLDEAVTHLSRSVEQTPNRMTPRVRLGYAYLLMGKADEALEQLRAAEQLTPTEREVARGIPTLLLMDLARAHAAKGNTNNAMKYLLELKKNGQLEVVDLRGPEFETLENVPEFQKLQRK